jgi:hypothetical protein
VPIGCVLSFRAKVGGQWVVVIVATPVLSSSAVL